MGQLQVHEREVQGILIRRKRIKTPRSVPSLFGYFLGNAKKVTRSPQASGSSARKMLELGLPFILRYLRTNGSDDKGFKRHPRIAALTRFIRATLRGSV
jgi:hypothetical protein